MSFDRLVSRLIMGCGKAAPRPCGWQISIQRERAADLQSCPEVIHTASERKGAPSGWRAAFGQAVAWDSWCSHVDSWLLNELTNSMAHGERLPECVRPVSIHQLARGHEGTNTTETTASSKSVLLQRSR